MTILGWLALLLAVVILVLVALRARDKRAWKRNHEYTDQEWAATVAARDQDIVDRHHAWEAFAEEFRGELREAKDAEERVRNELAMVRAWASKGMRWEQASRELIIHAANQHDWDGFVATNICFQAQGPRGPYMHQIDHLLVSRRGVLLIEAKNWEGLIFHAKCGARLNQQHLVEQLESLKDMPPGTPYVLRVKQGTDPIIIRGDRGREPAQQARAQAGALASALKREGLGHSIPFIDTCVFYSHESSILMNGYGAIDQTAIADRSRLGTVLTSRRGSCSDPMIRALGRWASEHGADVYGIGDYRNTWRSAFPLPAFNSGSWDRTRAV